MIFPPFSSHCFFNCVKDILSLGIIKIVIIFSVDATKCQSMGKMVNDVPSPYVNARMKRVHCENETSICLFAVKEISEGTEIRLAQLNLVSCFR